MTGRALIPCLNCGKPNDAHSNPMDDADVPDEGDLSICLYCGELSAYTITDGILGTRPLTEQEERDVAGNEYLQHLIAARKQVMG